MWPYVNLYAHAQKVLLRNGLSNYLYRLTVTAARVSRVPVVSLERRIKKRSTAGH